jgi:hypothetical protein
MLWRCLLTTTPTGVGSPSAQVAVDAGTPRRDVNALEAEASLP